MSLFLLRIFSFLLLIPVLQLVHATEITGAGATFPSILYQSWAVNYAVNKGVNVDYQAVGSGEGLKRIEAKAVDFGASDMPLNLEDLNQKKLMQFPMVMGAITPVVNLPGVRIGQLKLDGQTLADIYQGRIAKWNDPEILKLNPEVRLPNMKITVIYREDKSGTTFNFTNYLSKVSRDWKNKVGEGLTVKWPVGDAAKGNVGVADRVKETLGAIGYMDYAHAMERHLDYIQLKNRDGYYVKPNAITTQAAAFGAKWDPSNGFNTILTDAEGINSWPIAATTFILMRKDVDADQTRQILKYMDWNYRTGELHAINLDFVMLPKEVIEQVRASWKNIFR